MSDLFNNVKPGDMVHYKTPQGQHGKGKVVLRYDTHVVVNRGGGNPQVVNDKNYVKHERGGKVIGALLSRLKEEEVNEDVRSPTDAEYSVAKKFLNSKKNASDLALGGLGVHKKTGKIHVQLITKSGAGAGSHHVLSPEGKELNEVSNKTLLSYMELARRQGARNPHIDALTLTPKVRARAAKRDKGYSAAQRGLARNFKAGKAPVEESVLATVGAVAGAAAMGYGIAKAYGPKIKAHLKTRKQVNISKKMAQDYIKRGQDYSAKAKEPGRSKRSVKYHTDRGLEQASMAAREVDRIAKLKGKKLGEMRNPSGPYGGHPYDWDPTLRKAIFAAAAEKVKKLPGSPQPSKLDTGRTLKSKPAPYRRGVAEDSKDAEGAAERVAKTKKHKKKLHELDNSTLASYVSKAIADRKKAASGKEMAHRIHTPERAAYFDAKMDKRMAKRSKGIKTAVGKIASNLPAEKVNEVSAPGKEAWIKANKARFIERYGKEKGLRVLYAKAWKDVKNESVDESLSKGKEWYRLNQDVHYNKSGEIYTPSGKTRGHMLLGKGSAGYFDGDHFVSRGSKWNGIKKSHVTKVNEAKESEYMANLHMTGNAPKAAKGHYLMRDGRKLSGPHSPEEAVKQYKGMSDSKGVKIVHVKEDAEYDVTIDLISEDKVKKAAQKAISLSKKAKGNKHVDTEPKLDIQDKGGGGPMGGSHEDPEGSVNAKI